MQKITLITGASSGIGKALAKVYAQNGHDVALVARSKDKLKKFATRLENDYNIKSHVFAYDLTERSAPQKLFSDTQKKNLWAHTLINNAGFASFGAFHTLDLKKELAEIDLNVRALTELTHLFLQEMVSNNAGAILNVASTAAFQPGPLMAVYYASKAYVLHFTEALAEEYAASNISISALCPGPVKSEFQKRAKMEKSKLMQGEFMSPDIVARIAYKEFRKGTRIIIPDKRTKLLAQVHRFLPRSTTTKIIKKIQESGQ